MTEAQLQANNIIETIRNFMRTHADFEEITQELAKEFATMSEDDVNDFIDILNDAQERTGQ